MPDPATSASVRKGRGCLFYGCLTCLVLLLIAGLMAFFTARYIRNRIVDYTDAAPMTLPKVEMGETESRQLQERVKAFGDAMEKDQPTEPLVLSERDVNALIANLAAAKELARSTCGSTRAPKAVRGSGGGSSRSRRRTPR